MVKATEEGRPKTENTLVLPCTCEHAEQDKLHGKGRRVHNRTKQNKPAIEQRWRCTVCRNEKPI